MLELGRGEAQSVPGARANPLGRAAASRLPCAPMAKVLVSTDLPGPALDLLRAHHDVEVGPGPVGLGREGLIARIGDAAAVITRVSDRVDEVVLERAASLKLVANCGVGVDNVDLAACRRRGILVSNTPDVLTDATADYTFALILAACRRVAEGDRLVRAGGWLGFSFTEMLGVRVTGASLGIVGLGRIGRAVAARARGFSMRVRYAQRHRAGADVEAALDATHVELDELLAVSDIVCLCCPLNESTRGLLSRERIARMKRGAVLINTARGACVDSLAVAEALRSGQLFAAGLDAFPSEPAIEPALLACDNAVLSPHIASAERPTREAMASLSVESVIDVLAGRAPRHPVP
jgi:glyoxylate reductase